MTNEPFLDFFLELFNFLKFTSGDVFEYVKNSEKPVTNLEGGAILLMLGFFISILVNWVATFIDFFDENSEFHIIISPILILIGLAINTIYSYIVVLLAVLINTKFIGLSVLCMFLIWMGMALWRNHAKNTLFMVSSFNVVGALSKFNRLLIEQLSEFKEFKKNYDKEKSTNMVKLFNF